MFPVLSPVIAPGSFLRTLANVQSGLLSPVVTARTFVECVSPRVALASCMAHTLSVECVSL